MNILIVGESGCGKSNLSDVIRNGIFKADPDSNIHVDDPDRSRKDLGEGNNGYSIIVRREMLQEDADNADIVVKIKSKAFVEKYHELY